MSRYTEALQRIWAGYKIYSQAAFVMRSGFQLVDACDDMEEKLAKRVEEAFVGREGAAFSLRGESVLEHQAKVAWLAAAFACNIPDYFRAVESFPTSIKEQNWLEMITGLCHDVGEIAIGDIPDDGGAAHGTKDEAELAMFEQMAAAFSLSYSGTLGLRFRDFQNKWTKVGQALFALDKLEAVLTLLMQESYGNSGKLTRKPQMTELDTYLVEQTNSEYATDCWAAHMRMRVNALPDEVRIPVLELLQIAVLDVRGGVFSWWDKEIPPWPNG